MACIPYKEQDGVKRQEEPSQGLKIKRYALIAPINMRSTTVICLVEQLM
jgi:hypothetical protein